MQHWQHRAVAHWVEELVGMPGGRQRSGFRLTVAHNHGSNQIGIVEGGITGMRYGIPEFTALMD
jgi:hypothetical protein